jgi:hypothetical protein
MDLLLLYFSTRTTGIFATIARHGNGMTTKKSLTRTLMVVALLIGEVLLLEFVRTLQYVYPQLDFEENFFTFYPTFLALAGTLLFYLIFIVVRLVQRRLIEVLALLLLPFLFGAGVVSIGQWNYSAAWKFRINKPEYVSVLATDPSPPPKYHVFDWGNRGGGFGSPVFYEAIVYDESDEIAREPSSRSPEWVARRSSPWPGAAWITEPPGPHAQPCHRSIKDFGEHFYFIQDVC